MALPISITYTFSTATGTIPLSQLDTNFSLLTSTINGIGSGSTALVTPALGTPTSGTLTNCTGYTYANLGGTVPTWNQNTTGTASNVTGIVAIANGGTGQITQTAAFDALSPNTTKGDLIVYDGTDNVRFPVGTNTYVLTADSTTATGVKWAASASSGVTSVTGTAPISSSGGTTPAISISQATTSTNGYLSSTDWNTFNNKGSGTVTSVSALTLGTTGTDLSSSVATGTTTPVITLNVPTASATNRGVLSSTDWTTFNNKGSGTVTSVGWTGGIVSIATATTTPAFTIAGTSGGIPYFSSGTTWASSAVLASNAIMVGGGAGVAPSTVTTGTGVVTALGVNTGTAGAFVVNGGALGTPSSGTVTNLTGTASININGTVGATTASTGTFTQLTVNGANLNTAISPTGTGTVTISPAGALTINPTAASTINNASIGQTTPLAGSFTALSATSNLVTSVTAATSGLTANTTVTNSATYTTAGITLATQTAAAGSVWRIRAYGQFVAASSATARTAQIACFWGTTQLTAIAPTVIASTAQTTQWQAEFELSATSTTAIWTTGQMINKISSSNANFLGIDQATPASTTVTAGAQTLDLRVAVSTAVAAESWVIQQVTMERIK
jgi:hypothetical protein